MQCEMQSPQSGKQDLSPGSRAFAHLGDIYLFMYLFCDLSIVLDLNKQKQREGLCTSAVSTAAVVKRNLLPVRMVSCWGMVCSQVELWGFCSF